MGMQSASMQTPYSSAPQGKGRGLPNPEAQMSPNQPPETIRDQMMRKFPQGNTGIMNPQDGAMGQPIGDQNNTGAVYQPSPFGNGNTGVVGPNQSQGKGQGAMGAVTFPGQGGQPKLGQANPYPNTINPSDNTGMARHQAMGSGKSGGSAKGAQ